MARVDLSHLVAVAGISTILAGCDHYIDRRDTVTFGAGDAVAANKAMQIIDPWPQAARTINHGMSGEQAEAAMQKLRRRTAGEDGAAAPPSTLLLSPAPVAPKP